MDKFTDYTILQKNLVQAINLKPDHSIDNLLKLEWNNQAAIARANELYKLLGNPQRYDPQPHGIVLWRMVNPFFLSQNENNNLKDEDKPTHVYSKLMILDEEIPHLIPVPHTDWFYAYMYMDIPDDKVNDVRSLTESVQYDTMTREIVARCHFMEANLTTLYLAKQIAQGHKNLAHAQQEYSVLIPKLAEEGKKNLGMSAQGNMGPWHLTLTQYTFGLK